MGKKDEQTKADVVGEVNTSLSKKEAKKIDKLRCRIEYHKCRVSNFKGPCVDKEQQMAAVGKLEQEIASIEYTAL